MVMDRPELAFTMNLGAACAEIDCATGLFDGQNKLLLGVLRHLDERARTLDVPNRLLLQLPTVSATAIMQLLNLL